jgi:hypothetical protein
MQSARWVLPLVALLAGPGDVMAQSSQDDTVRKMLMISLDNIQSGVCAGGRPCAPASAEEKVTPPLSLSDAKAVVGRAVFSAAGEHCGLDWQKLNFLPMMSHWRTSKNASDRQLALIAILHGYALEQIKKTLAQRGPCTDAMRRDIKGRLAFGT